MKKHVVLKSVLLSTVFLLIVVICFFTFKPYKIRLKRFSVPIKEKVNPIKLQQFATNMISTQKHGPIDESLIPEYINSISEQKPDIFVNTSGDGSDNICLWIVYGGGFGHWGLKVGNSNLPMPTDSDWSYYMKWEDGIYFWIQIR